MSSRRVELAYQDPLDLVWLQAARELGWKVVRSPSAYASWDGKTTLTLAPPSEFDADDCLAQMIFHEICHALVAGPSGMRQVDWGLDNTSERDLDKEHACHRLQAALAEPLGLRDFMAVTTQHRTYWDALPANPLTEGDDPAIALAQQAYARSRREPFASVVEKALVATASIADVVRRAAGPESLWSLTRARHRTGFLMPRQPVALTESRTCGTCAWGYRDAGQPGATDHATIDQAGEVLRCRQTMRAEEPGLEVAPEEPGCERWEASFDEEECGRCGACCHQGFDLVPVEEHEVFLERHRALVVQTTFGLHVPRPSGRCVVLDGNGASTSPYRCRHYAERPQACADFEVRGAACLLARRRVGLSR